MVHTVTECVFVLASRTLLAIMGMATLLAFAVFVSILGEFDVHGTMLVASGYALNHLHINNIRQTWCVVKMLKCERNIIQR